MHDLLVWDLKLFLKINRDWSNAFFDAILPWLREPYFWAPLYMFLLVFVVYNFGWRGLVWCALFLITFAFTDQIGGILKSTFGRVRPCRDPNIQELVRLLHHFCPSSGSFTSNHASNHFGLGVFILFTLKDYFKSWAWLFIFWGVAIGYSQVYVGVHYPLDIVGGALLGLVAGTVTSFVYNRFIKQPFKSEKI
jgi:membrane-associated phospholipid phosphatase